MIFINSLFINSIMVFIDENFLLILFSLLGILFLIPLLLILYKKRKNKRNKRKNKKNFLIKENESRKIKEKEDMELKSMMKLDTNQDTNHESIPSNISGSEYLWFNFYKNKINLIKRKIKKLDEELQKIIKNDLSDEENDNILTIATSVENGIKVRDKMIKELEQDTKKFIQYKHNIQLKKKRMKIEENETLKKTIRKKNKK